LPGIAVEPLLFVHLEYDSTLTLTGSLGAFFHSSRARPDFAPGPKTHLCLWSEDQRHDFVFGPRGKVDFDLKSTLSGFGRGQSRLWYGNDDFPTHTSFFE